MRVLHIIPAAFDYFNAVRDQAFALVEAEQQMGIEAEAYTLQYGAVSKRMTDEVHSIAPSRHFQGLSTQADFISALANFDLIHVHVPLLGMAGKIIRWKQSSPTPIVITDYGPFKTSDLFSHYIVAYNAWYVPRLRRLAGEIISLDAGALDELQLSQMVLQYRAIYDRLI